MGIPLLLFRQPQKKKTTAVPWYLGGGIPASNCVAAYQPIGAASLAESYVNLANPGTYDATPGVAPTFNTIDGWAFNGSTQYLTTGIFPTPNTGNWSAICRFSNRVGNGTLFGALAQTGGVTRFYIIPSRDGSVLTYANGTELNVAGVLVSGNLAFAGNTGYRNGIADPGTIGAWVGTATRALFIGANNSDGSAGSFFNGKIQALAFYNITLSPSQIAELYAKMAVLPF